MKIEYNNLNVPVRQKLSDGFYIDAKSVMVFVKKNSPHVEEVSSLAEQIRPDAEGPPQHAEQTTSHADERSLTPLPIPPHLIIP